MDQAAVNGAQVFYFNEFDIQDEWMQGLLNGAPYLCSALIGCWVRLKKYSNPPQMATDLSSPMHP